MLGMLRRSIHIVTQGTPNPHSLKFVPGKDVTGDLSTTIDFSAAKFATISPLAQTLFSVDGVTRVFYGKDFISVTKEENLPWEDVVSELSELIKAHYLSGEPLFTGKLDEMPDDLEVLDSDSEALAMVKEIIAARVKPFV